MCLQMKCHSGLAPRLELQRVEAESSCNVSEFAPIAHLEPDKYSYRPVGTVNYCTVHDISRK